MKRFFALSAMVLTLSVAGVTYAEPPHGAGDPRPNLYSMEKFKASLNLSDSQVVEIEKLNAAFRDKHRMNKEKTKPLETRLRDLEKSGSSDYVTMEQLLKDISLAHADARLDKIKHHHALLELLNPQQKEALKAKMEKKREKMKDRMKDRDKDKPAK
jgi:Spy/CpxP family protein refolding chaperone